jgi:hypothetical protein
MDERLQCHDVSGQMQYTEVHDASDPVMKKINLMNKNLSYIRDTENM